MDLTSLFSDDQLALIGCVGALALCGLVAAISFHFGPAGQQVRAARRGTAGRIPAVPSRESSARQDRRAA